jgi:hypothetical protein
MKQSRPLMLESEVEDGEYWDDESRSFAALAALRRPTIVSTTALEPLGTA